MMDLIYPPLCTSCGVLRPLDNHIFCLDCLHELPETGYHTVLHNPFTDHFKGRIDLQSGNIAMSPLNLTGEIAFSEALREQMAWLPVMFEQFTQKDGFYQVKLGGTLGAPNPMGP